MKLAKLKDGSGFSIAPNNGEIHITGKGKTAYIWIGNSICFGTLSGQKTLKKLAQNILKAVK
jgi:hypothetical protein